MSRQRGDAVLVFIIALFALVIALIVAAVMVSVREQREWQAFAASHECKVVGRKKAQVVPTTGYSNGKPVFGTTVVPGQVAYLCDDGVTYWR